ncbi:MAG: hypothetical protein U0228_06135 [Myxococcaceae bacterium]
MSPQQRSWVWLLVAAAVWGVAWGVQRWKAAQPQRPEWQRPVSELTSAQQAIEASLRAALPAAEAQRDASGAWPGGLRAGFEAQRLGLTINYVGEAEGLRWLVVVLEPDPRVPPEDAGVDDEHHRLPSGAMLHVSVWTQPLSATPPTSVVAFPAAEGWTQRVR